MAKPYKARNKRIIMRRANGRFRKATGTDFGIGGICSCGHLLILHYNGDKRDRPCDPRKWIYRCFTCQPLTEAELILQAEIKASEAKPGLASMIIEAAERN